LRVDVVFVVDFDKDRTRGAYGACDVVLLRLGAKAKSN